MSEAKAAKRPAGLGCVQLVRCASAILPKPSSAGQLPPVSLPTPRHRLTLLTYLPTWTFLYLPKYLPDTFLSAQSYLMFIRRSKKTDLHSNFLLI